MKLQELIDELQEIQDDFMSNDRGNDITVCLTDNAHRCAKNISINGIVSSIQAEREAHEESEGIPGEFPTMLAPTVYLVLGYEMDPRYTPAAVLDALNR